MTPSGIEPATFRLVAILQYSTLQMTYTITSIRTPYHLLKSLLMTSMWATETETRLIIYVTTESTHHENCV
jgi:hypothetical protein